MFLTEMILLLLFFSLFNPTLLCTPGIPISPEISIDPGCVCDKSPPILPRDSNFTTDRVEIGAIIPSTSSACTRASISCGSDAKSIKLVGPNLGRIVNYFGPIALTCGSENGSKFWKIDSFIVEAIECYNSTVL